VHTAQLLRGRSVFSMHRPQNHIKLQHLKQGQAGEGQWLCAAPRIGVRVPAAVQEFLACPEQARLPLLSRPTENSVAVKFAGTVRWGSKLAPVLVDVNFSALRGQLVVVLGATGSGKTALLYALLGLTDAVPGNRSRLLGSCAFVAQQTFIFGGAAPRTRAAMHAAHSTWCQRWCSACRHSAGEHPVRGSIPCGRL
jgi:ABC-type multidrug transport system fused ATPase/permease subunit